MSILVWTWIITGASFAMYIYIAYATRAKSTGDFYAAEQSVPAYMNGMATGADWMSAASFISMAGLISFMGRDGSFYLMGWTGGYVLLAMLFGPYLRKYGKFTIPQFMADRYYSQVDPSDFAPLRHLRIVHLRGRSDARRRRGFLPLHGGLHQPGCYHRYGAGFLLRHTGRHEGDHLHTGFPVLRSDRRLHGSGCFYLDAVHRQPDSAAGHGFNTSPPMVQHCSTIPVLQGKYLLDVLNGIQNDIGFGNYTDGSRPRIDVWFITMSLMIGTAGLPHILIRFFTVPKMRDARSSAGYALICIAILYTTAPAIAVFARTNFVKSINNVKYVDAPSWFKNWEKTGLVKFDDKNGDGVMTIAKGKWDDPKSANEVKIDQDIMVLANPEIAKLPNWVVGLVGAGGLAAALSTAAGLLLVISAAISHDLMKGILKPDMGEKEELIWARVGAGVAVCIAGLFGIYPPGFVAQVVAFAFGLAAASFFPCILMGIFNKKANKEGAIAGMVIGIIFVAGYISYFKFVNPAVNNAKGWWFGISPEGIGTVGALLNFATMWIVGKFTPEPPQEIQDLVGSLRYPGKLVAPPTQH